MWTSLLAGAAIKGTLLLVLLFVAAAALRRAPASMRHLLWAAGFVGLLLLPAISGVLPWRIAVPSAALPPTAVFTPGSPASPDEVEGADSDPDPASVERTVGDRAEGTDPYVGTTGDRVATTDDPAAVTDDAVATTGALADATAAETGMTKGDRSPSASTDRPRSSSAEAWRALVAPALPDRIHPLVLLWLGGVLLVGGWFVVGALVVRSIVRKGYRPEAPRWTRLLDRAALRIGEHGHVRLILSPAAPIPFATGVSRPTIVLPESAVDWTDERCSAVLLHELAHVRRRDGFAHLVSRIASALYWFNPLTWLAARRLRAEGERACDDLVIGTGARPSKYARHLIEVVRSARRSWAIGAARPMAGRSEFEGRLLAILEPGARRSGPRPGIAGAMVLSVALSVVPLAALGPDGAGEGSAGELTSTFEAPEIQPEAGPEKNDFDQLDVAKDATAAEADAERRAAPLISAVGEDVADGPPVDVRAADRETDGERGADRETGSDGPAEFEGDAGSVSDPTSNDKGRAIAVGPGQQRTLVAEKSLQLDAERETKSLQSGVEAYRVRALIQALGDRDVGVRQAVVTSLGDLGDTLAVNALMRALREDPDAEVRVAAARALGEIEDARAVPALGDALRQDDVPAVRIMAARALGAIEDPRAVEPLGAAMADDDVEVRKVAIRALGEIESPDAIPALTRALDDEDAAIRQLAAAALGEIEDARAVGALGSALSDENAAVRAQAARALGEIEHGSAVAPLSAALDDPDSQVRRVAISALGEIEDTRAVEPLVGVLSDPDVELRILAARALGEIEDSRAVEPLVAALRDEDYRVRAVAARALGEIEDPGAAPGLVEALGDPDTRVRLEVVQALGELELTAAPPQLIAALDDENPQIRLAAADALGEIEDPAAVEGLAALLDDPISELRREAIRALAEIEHPDAYQVLVRALEDEDPEIRRMAARALGQR